MKDTMIDMMVVMMPLMKPFMWFVAAVVIIGFLLVAVKFSLKNEYKKAITWSGRIALIASVFFLAAQVAGQFLSMPPTINFGDSSKFEFILVSFWQVGLAFLVSGLIIKFLGKIDHSHAV